MTEPIPDFDLYELLEVSPTASAPTIEAAWRSLMKRNHPDLRGKDAEKRARRLNVAHDWLTDTDRRARYDRERTAEPTRAQTPRRTSPPAPQPSTTPMGLWRLVFLLSLALMPIGGLGGWTDLLLLAGILAVIYGLVLILEKR